MAFVIADRVRETTTTIGTGSVTLGGAYTSFQTFSAAIGNGNNTYYTIASASSGEWEVGIGTYASGGNLLSRDTVLSSSNAGNLVNFSVGSKDVFVTQPSERSLLINAASNGLFAGNAAFTANGVPYANSTTTLTTGSALTFDGTTFKSPILFASSTDASGNVLQIDTTSTAYGRVGGSTTMGYVAGTQSLWTIGGSEQMRLTSTGLGIGTSSPLARLHVSQLSTNTAIGTSGAQGLYMTNPGTTVNAFSRIDFSGSSNGATASIAAQFTNYATGATDLVFGTYGGAAILERMRLDSSGNLGIGTSSPGTKLDTVGVMRGTFNSTSNGGPTTHGLELRQSTTSTKALIAGYSTSGNQVGAYIQAVNFGIAYEDLVIQPQGGNLGLGVTPSAWSTSGWKALEVGFAGNAFTSNAGNSSGIASNAVLTSTGWKYGVNGSANFLAVGNAGGSYAFFTAPSGTAGDPISFTQAMTLDASGNLGVGTTSPGAKLEVSESNANSVGVRVTNSSQTSQLLSLAMAGSSGHGVPGWDNSGIVEAVADGVGSGTRALYLSAYNGPMLFATNGRVERMRLDSSGNLGIGTSSPATKLDVNGGTNSDMRLTTSGSGYLQVGQFTNGAFIGTSSSDATAGQLRLGTGGAAQVWLSTAGNLGIGTSSPNAKLAVVGGGIRVNGYSGNSAGDGVNVQIGTTGGVNYLQSLNGTGTNNLSIDANQITFRTGSFATTATFDSSGNLGLGVTPVVGYGNSVQLKQIGGGATAAFLVQAVNTDDHRLYVTNNALPPAGGFTGGFNYTLSNASATAYLSVAGQHRWLIAPPGNAGDPITFTQAMTLDASGNLSLGTTSTTERLRVQSSDNYQISFRQQSASGLGAIGTDASNNFLFYNNGSERARIDSSGNLLVGTTLSGIGTARAIVYNDSTNFAGIFANVNATSASTSVLRIYHVGASGGTSAVMLELLNASGSVVGTITSSGTATAYNTSSDYRLKNITGPITNSGAYIDSLNPVEGTWKADGSTFVGLIAHEVQDVSRTQVATGEKDGEEMQGMDYSSSEIIANLIAELQSLRRRVAQLEGTQP